MRSGVQLGAPVIVFGDSADGGFWQSADTYDFKTRVDLRFPVTLEMVRLIEETVPWPGAVHCSTQACLFTAEWTRGDESVTQDDAKPVGT